MPFISKLKSSRSFIVAKILVGLLAVFLFVFIAIFQPPRFYPVGAIVEVPNGIGLYQLSQKLEAEHIIRSPFWFRTFAIILGGERKMKAGQYFLDHAQSAPALTWRIINGDYKIETEKITVPEGFSNEKISKLFPDDKFEYFDNEKFMREAPQGYLFPDTYFLPITTTATSAIKVMRQNFDNKIASVQKDIEASGHSLREILIMASLIEAETNNQVDRELVSGILWKRLKNGMPLQVDVEMRTYEFLGLPSEPINNPGLLSIKASIHPTSSLYVYYLTGKDGLMHYAKTFDEHRQNISKYLSK